MFFTRRQRLRIRSLYYEYRRAFWILVGVTFIDRLGGALLFPFFALYITSKFNVGMSEVGVLFALFFVSSAIGTTLGGALTDRWGRKRMIIFSLLSSSLSTVLMGLVDTLSAFYVLALVSGIFTDTGGPAYEAMTADLLPESKRAQGFGIIRVALNLAVAIGPLIGGLLATRSYLLLFVIDAIVSAVVALLVFLYLPETKPRAKVGAPRESLAATFRGYFQVLRDKTFMLFFGACILSTLVYMNMNTTLGVYLRDEAGVAEAGYGLLISLNALMVVFLQFPITRRIEDRPPMIMMAVGTALYAIGFALYGFVSTYFYFAVAMAIITVGEMIVIPVARALTANLAPEDMRGRYMAVFGFSWGIPFAVGPYLAGLIMDSAADPSWLWYITGMVGAVAVAGFLYLQRRVPQPALSASAEKVSPRR
jgi:MFS family permease